MWFSAASLFHCLLYIFHTCAVRYEYPVPPLQWIWEKRSGSFQPVDAGAWCFIYVHISKVWIINIFYMFACPINADFICPSRMTKSLWLFNHKIKMLNEFTQIKLKKVDEVFHGAFSKRCGRYIRYQPHPLVLWYNPAIIMELSTFMWNYVSTNTSCDSNSIRKTQM